MARHLNANCDFDSGFFMSDMPGMQSRVVLKIKTKWGKHTLTEDYREE